MKNRKAFPVSCDIRCSDPKFNEEAVNVDNQPRSFYVSCDTYFISIDNINAPCLNWGDLHIDVEGNCILTEKMSDALKRCVCICYTKRLGLRLSKC